MQNNRQKQPRRSIGLTLVCSVICFVLPTLLTACVDSHAVTVRKERLLAQKHTLDGKNNPKSAGGNHCSMNPKTCWEFRFVPTVAVTKTKGIKDTDWYSSTVKVQHVTVEVSLPFDMWLPDNPSDQVVEHEDGHVRICRHFYRDAAHQARKCGLHLIGREYTGEAKDEQTAEKLAIDAACAELTSCYQEKIAEPANRASADYDKLTAPGANQLSVSDAIDKAIGEVQ